MMDGAEFIMRHALLRSSSCDTLESMLYSVPTRVLMGNSQACWDIYEIRVAHWAQYS